MPPDRKPVRHDPALPAPFEPVFGSLEEIRYSDPGSRFHQCFGCGPDHDIGLRVRTFLAGAAVGHTGRVHWTGELSVRYVKPTPVERPLLGRARAVRQSEKYLDLEGTLEDLDTGEVLARATGRFFPMRDRPMRDRPAPEAP